MKERELGREEKARRIEEHKYNSRRFDPGVSRAKPTWVTLVITLFIVCIFLLFEYFKK